jgi:hypothetical protein
LTFEAFEAVFEDFDSIGQFAVSPAVFELHGQIEDRFLELVHAPAEGADGSEDLFDTDIEIGDGLFQLG